MDRDGTLIKDAHYLKDPELLEIIERPTCFGSKPRGAFAFLHTNQSGIARGYYDWQDVYVATSVCTKSLAGPLTFVGYA